MTGPTLHINDRKQIKRMKSLICLALLFLALSVRGQGITLTGNVRDGKDQSALQDVNVVISSQGHKDITAYTISDQKGSFRLTYTPAKDKEYVIRFSYLGYETVVLNIEKSITQYNVALHAQAIGIKEIIVKAPKIKSQGDTIIYNVASFSKEGDKTIGDVLKKLPGVRVEENRQISYQGTAINKFYIEGMDLLGGKYNIATNNISNDDVGSVEIMENHQPIKALNGLSISEQAAINLRLKEKAKQKWIGSLKGGGGFTPSSGLWTAEVIAMHFNKNFQSLNTYKTNNTGQDVTKEFKSFDLNERRYGSEKLTDYIHISSLYPHELNRERELFNTTHQVTSNNLSRLKSRLNITTHIGWIDHKEQADKQTITQYYQADADTITVREHESSLYKKQTLAAGITLDINEEQYNMTNRLMTDFTWKHKDEAVNGNLPNIQNSYSPDKQLVNDLYLLKKFGKKFIIFSSYSFLQDNPQKLSVLYTKESPKVQRIEQRKLFSDNKVDYGIVAGKLVINTTVGFSLLSRNMRSRLTGMEQVDKAENYSHVNSTRLYLISKLEYSLGKLKSYLSLPVYFYTSRYSGKTTASKEKYTKLSLNPRLYVTYPFSSRWQMDITGSVSSSPSGESLFYTGYIMNSYRTMSEGYPVYKQNRRQMIEGNLSYKQAMEELFGNLSVRYSRSTTPYTPYQQFQEGYLISSYQEGENNRNQFSISASLSKGISWIKGYIFLDAAYSDSRSLLVRNDLKVPNAQRTWHIVPRLETDLFRWLTMKYKLNYAYSILALEDEETATRNISLNQQLSLRFSPFAKVSMELVAEHYHNESSTDRTRDFFLADFILSHKISSKWEIEVLAKNLMNEQRYVYTSFTDEASTVSRSYDIRPRNLMMTIKYSY